MANISRIVNVTLNKANLSSQRDNMNLCALMINENTHVNSKKRYILVNSAKELAQKFGSNSLATQYGNVFFASQPNPTNAGGALIVAFHRATAETVPASAGFLTGAVIDGDLVLNTLRPIADGSFSIKIDGTATEVKAIDFTTATTFNDIVASLNTALGTKANVTFNDNRIVITSKTTGASSAISDVKIASAGTYIGDSLGLETGGGGAVATGGAASSSLPAEKVTDALSVLKQEINFKGVCFIKPLSTSDLVDVPTWLQANNTLGYEVFGSVDNLEINSTNPVWKIKLANQVNFRCLYSKSNNRKLAIAYMARVHTVNFNAINSAITLNLKSLSVPAEYYDDSEISKAYDVGLDLYTTIKQTPVVLTSPSNDFVDNVYNLIAYIDALETDIFNYLASTSTKIPQTNQGVNGIIDQVLKTTRQFARADVFAPGTWTSPDIFGDRETFLRHIEQFGYYFLAGALSDQTQADREARKAPVIQGAVKNAGAIHSVDIIINFNK